MSELEIPLVSVVIPTYNHAHYLSRSVQSVLDQTFCRWEVIVIDNHSTDNTDEIMASFVDKRITYFKIHNNGVIAASRNAGINAAKGEWVAFLDSDDWWTADKLHVFANHISEKVDLVYHDLEIVSERPRRFRGKLIKSWQVNPPVVIDLLVRGNAIATSSVVVRSMLLKRINGMSESPDMVGAEDINAWARIAMLTERFKYISKRLGFYQIHQQGVSRLKDMSVPSRRALSEFVALLSQQQKKKFEANMRYAKGRFEYLLGNVREARENLLFCLRHGSPAIKIKSAITLISCVVWR